MKQSGRKSKSNSASSDHRKDIENMLLPHEKLTDKQALVSQIQHQINRQHNNQQKIKALKERIESLKAQKIKKQQKLEFLQAQTTNIKNKKLIENESLRILKDHIMHLREKLRSNLLESDFEDDEVDVDNMTYEVPHFLYSDKIGKVSKGITNEQFSSLNKLPYSAQCGENACLICQDQLKVSIECITLKCGHLFHVDCLQQWLQKQKICPLCKAEVL